MGGGAAARLTVSATPSRLTRPTKQLEVQGNTTDHSFASKTSKGIAELAQLGSMPMHSAGLVSPRFGSMGQLDYDGWPADLLTQGDGPDAVVALEWWRVDGIPLPTLDYR